MSVEIMILGQKIQRVYMKILDYPVYNIIWRKKDIVKPLTMSWVGKMGQRLFFDNDDYYQLGASHKSKRRTDNVFRTLFFGPPHPPSITSQKNRFLTFGLDILRLENMI